MSLKTKVNQILKQQKSIKSARIVIDLNPLVVSLYGINKNENIWCLFLNNQIIFNSHCLKANLIKAQSNLMKYDIKQADLEFILKEINKLA